MVITTGGFASQSIIPLEILKGLRTVSTRTWAPGGTLQTMIGEMATPVREEKPSASSGAIPSIPGIPGLAHSYILNTPPLFIT